MGSLPLQPGRQFDFFETAEELPGCLEIPEYPFTTSTYTDIYRGLWITPQGERVQVAIKQLRTISTGRKTEREALQSRADMSLKREVFVWSQATHPNLHPILGYRSQPQPRIISPWCHHSNIKDYLRENPGLTRYDKLRLIFQTACALEHLHSQTPPICHTNIKPENVLINDYHGVALSDYGLNRVMQDLVPLSGFTSEPIGRNIRYMASELFAGQKPNLQSDVYAFGGLILSVMSGKAPFDRLLHHVILRRVILDDPPIPKDHPELPAHDPLWKLMRCCWNNDPTARPLMREVLTELLGMVILEEFIPGSRLDLPAVTADEYVNTNLDIVGNLQHKINLLSLNADPVAPETSKLVEGDQGDVEPTSGGGSGQLMDIEIGDGETDSVEKLAANGSKLVSPYEI